MHSPIFPARSLPAANARENLLANLRKAVPFLDQDYRNARDDLALYERLAKERPGPILELGCGTGRVLAALRRAGRVCAGLDISPPMLAEARRRLGPGTALHCADMSDFALQRTDFALAIAATNALMHLPSAAHQCAALRCVSRHLKPGGLLVVDLFNPPVVELVLQAGHQMAVDSWEGESAGVSVTKWMRRDVNWTHQVQTTRITYETLHADNRLERVECCFNLRFLWKNEMEMMLKQAGFELLRIWGAYSQTALCDEAEVMIFCAERR